MGISLNKYMTRRQREAGVKRTPVSSAAQEPVKAAWETGGSSLDRHMSAPKGGAWDIRRDRRGQRSATVSGGAPTSNAPAGSAAASYQRQTVPEDLRARLERTPNRQTVPEDLRARLERTPYRRQTPTAPKDWKGAARETFSPTGMLNFADKMELRTVAEGSGARIEALKKAEAEALKQSIIAGSGYLHRDGRDAVYNLITGTNKAKENSDAAAAAYAAARSKREAAEQAAEEARQTLARMRYEGFQRAADFGEKSAYKTTFDPAKPVKLMNMGQGGLYYDTSGYGDLRYDYINKDPAAVNAYSHNNNKAILVGAGEDWIQEMTGEEVATYNYLYATQGKEAADEYVDGYLKPKLTARQREQTTEAMKAIAHEHPVMGSAVSIAMSPYKGISYLGQVIDYAADGKIDQNAGYNKWSYMPTAIRGQVSADIEKDLAEKAGEFWGKAGSFAYNTCMSMADFLLNSAIGGFGAGGSASQALTLAIMGTGAAADATIEAKDRGLSDDQAFALGTIAGLAEIITENVSLEALLKPDWEKGALKYVLKNALAEGSEEVGSDIINGIADVLISRDKSHWAESVQSYMNDPKVNGNEAMAFGLAARDAALEMGLDFLGGFFSGGVMSGAAAGGKAASAWNTGRQMNALGMETADYQAFVDEGAQSGKEFQAHALAEQAQAKLDAGKKLGNYELGNLWQANERAIAAEEQAAAQAQERARKEQQRQAKEQAKLKEQLFGPQAQETAASTGETAGESTAVNTDPAVHTPQEQVTVEEYQGAVDNVILSFIEKWRNLKDENYKKKIHIPVAQVTERAAQDVRALVGVDISGYEHALSGNALGHIERRHGTNGMADQSMADPNDIARIGYVLEHYDFVKPVLNSDGTQKTSKEYQNADHTPAPLVKFSKRVNGTYYVVEAVPDSAAHQMRVVSAYLSKANGSTDQMLNMPASGPQPTSKTPNGASASTSFSIPSPAEEVKAGLAYDPQYADAVTRRGGLTEDGKKAALRPGDFEKLDGLCRELGVHARFADGGEVLGGAGNAGISGREIVVARDHQGALRAVLGHELTHRLQELAPEEYNAFRDIVAADDAMAKKTAYAKELYASRGIELDDAGALDEVTADYAGALMENTQVLEEFIERHRENKSLLEKLLDAIRGIIAKLTGAEKRQAQTAEGKLAAALDAAAANAVQGQATAAGEQMAERFLLREVGGKKVVWLDKSPLTNKELNSHTAVAAYIAQHIGEVYTIIESGQSVYLGEDLPGEYTHSKYTTYLRKNDRAVMRAKRRAVGALGGLIETATNRRWERTRHPGSKDAKYGMYRYDSTFAFPVKDEHGATVRVRAYDMELLICNASDGKKYLYDIVNIKENTAAQSDLSEREARSAVHSTATGRGVSNDSISQTGGEVKRKFSLKDPAGFNEDMAPQPEQSQSAALAYDIQRMRQIGATLGKNGARALAAVYDETLAAQYAPEQVAESFIQIYNATLNGRRLSEAAARKAAELPDYIRLAAEDSAQRDLARAGQTAEMRRPAEDASRDPLAQVMFGQERIAPQSVESPGTIDGTRTPGYNTITETEAGGADKSGQTAARSDRAAAEPTRSDAAQGGGIGQRDYPGITNREKTAILSYKSSESYKINIILRDSGVDALPPNLRSIVDGLDSALPKLPKAEGTLYRTLCFDDLSDPKGALDAFLAEHEVGNTIIYPAYTSTSIRPDGHPLSGDTRYGVVMEINGESAHLLAFGNNFEKEALFPRNTRFCITKVEKKTDGLYHIYMEEAKAHGKADTGGERTARRTGAGLPRGAGERGPAEERRENVQQVQEAHTLYGGLHGVFGMDPG